MMEIGKKEKMMMVLWNINKITTLVMIREKQKKKKRRRRKKRKKKKTMIVIMMIMEVKPVNFQMKYLTKKWTSR